MWSQEPLFTGCAGIAAGAGTSPAKSHGAKFTFAVPVKCGGRSRVGNGEGIEAGAERNGSITLSSNGQRCCPVVFS